SRDLHSFPTRRSSDLVAGREGDAQLLRGAAGGGPAARAGVLWRQRSLAAGARAVVVGVQLLRRAARRGRHLRPQRGDAARARARSEEHTSELQSLAYL